VTIIVVVVINWPYSTSTQAQRPLERESEIDEAFDSMERVKNRHDIGGNFTE